MWIVNFEKGWKRKTVDGFVNFARKGERKRRGGEGNRAKNHECNYCRVPPRSVCPSEEDSLNLVVTH